MLRRKQNNGPVVFTQEAVRFNYFFQGMKRNIYEHKELFKVERTPGISTHEYWLYIKGIKFCINNVFLTKSTVTTIT
jgi:hypothetical protein